ASKDFLSTRSLFFRIHFIFSPHLSVKYHLLQYSGKCPNNFLPIILPRTAGNTSVFIFSSLINFVSSTINANALNPFALPGTFCEARQRQNPVAKLITLSNFFNLIRGFFQCSGGFLKHT